MGPSAWLLREVMRRRPPGPLPYSGGAGQGAHLYRKVVRSMGKGINKMVMARVIAAVISILLFSFLTTFNISRMQRMQTAAEQVNALLDRVQRAE